MQGRLWRIIFPASRHPSGSIKGKQIMRSPVGGGNGSRTASVKLLDQTPPLDSPLASNKLVWTGMQRLSVEWVSSRQQTQPQFIHSIVTSVPRTLSCRHKFSLSTSHNPIMKACTQYYVTVV